MNLASGGGGGAQRSSVETDSTLKPYLGSYVSESGIKYFSLLFKISTPASTKLGHCSAFFFDIFSVLCIHRVG